MQQANKDRYLLLQVLNIGIDLMVCALTLQMPIGRYMVRREM
jgi:hypothetical protein